MPRPTTLLRQLLVAGAITAAVSSAATAVLALFPDGALGAASGAAPAVCATSGLVVWLDTTGNGAAGSTYYNLEMTNLSGHACMLFGFPGVSAIGLDNRQIGSAATKNDAHKSSTVELANDATAVAVLQIVDAANFPTSTCGRTTAAGLRVYPPNERTAKVIPFPFAACSRMGPTFLHIEAAVK